MKSGVRQASGEARQVDVIEAAPVVSGIQEHLGPNLNPIPLPALIDVEGLARHLGVSVHHVRRLVQERRIPHLKVGVFVRFDPQEVARWLEERRVPEYKRRQTPSREPVT